MGVDRSVAGGSGKVLVFAVRNVQVGFGVAVFLGKTKVDDIDLVCALVEAHQKVVGFDVAVDKVFRVDIFDARNLWVSKKGER